MWMEISHRKNKKVWFRVDTNCRYSPLSCYKFSVSITIFLPILRASDFPWSVCIQHAFDLHPVPCECVFSVCFFLRPQSVGLHVWVHLSLWKFIFLSYFLGCETGRWDWPCPMVTYFSNVYSASRDLSHWNCWESRPSMGCIPPDALFCSALRKMLQYLNIGFMVPVGLSAFWNATKHGLEQSFKQRYSFFFWHLFKQA